MTVRTPDGQEFHCQDGGVVRNRELFDAMDKWLRRRYGFGVPNGSVLGETICIGMDAKVATGNLEAAKALKKAFEIKDLNMDGQKIE